MCLLDLDIIFICKLNLFYKYLNYLQYLIIPLNFYILRITVGNIVNTQYQLHAVLYNHQVNESGGRAPRNSWCALGTLLWVWRDSEGIRISVIYTEPSLSATAPVSISENGDNNLFEVYSKQVKKLAFNLENISASQNC